MTTKESASTARQSLSIPEAADELGVSVDTVRRMIARGDLPAWRIGSRLIRIDVDQLDKIRRPVTPTAAYRSALKDGNLR